MYVCAPTQTSRAEIMASVFAIRARAAAFLEEAAQSDTESFIHVCQSIYRTTMMSENLSPAWCRVRGARGLYVVCPSRSGPTHRALDGGVPVVEPGRYPVELDICALELRVAGSCPKGLEAEIADDKDVSFIFGRKVKVKHDHVLYCLSTRTAVCLCNKSSSAL